MLPPNVTALAEARERKAKAAQEKAAVQLRTTVAQAFPAKSPLVLPGSPGFYWHTRSGREETGRYVTGHGYDVEPGGAAGPLGEVDTWRKPEITLYDSPSVQPGDMQTVWPEGPPKVGGLLEQCVRKQPPCYVVVHPSQWETAKQLFESKGYLVLNADAPYTPHNSRDPR